MEWSIRSRPVAHLAGALGIAGQLETRPARVRATVVLLVAFAAGCAPFAPASTALPSLPSAASPSPSSSASSSSPAPIDLGPVPVTPLSAAISARLQAVLDEVVADGQSPGIAAAVVTIDGTWAGAAGVGDPASGSALSADAEFAIASISKTLVAALVLRQVEAGAMNLDAPLAQYLPGDLEEVSNGATLRQALGNQTGIPEYIDEPFVDEVLSDCSRTWTAAEVAALIPAPKLPPGSGSDYSNSNWILLGIALERTTGANLGELARVLLDPVDLRRVAYQPDEAPPEPLALPHLDIDQDGAWDELVTGGLLPCRSMATAGGAAGAFASDAPSLARWGWLLYGGGVLDPTSLAQMTAVGSDEYGLGTIRYIRGGSIGFGHEGRIPGYGSLLIVYPRERLAVAVLINADRGNILRAIAERLVGVVTP
jgi:D-alanyl-D-alanine carboxypeptidase